MTYTVATGHPDGRAHHWWANFLVYGWTTDDDVCLQDALDRHNSRARVIDGGFHRIGDNIMFETEHDFTVFVMKWS